MARTNIAVDQAVFDEFAAQAEEQNKTLFAFANESLKAVTKVAAEGGNPGDIYRLWRSFSLLKQMDAVTLPSDFVDELVASQYARDREGTLKMFRDLGDKVVSILKIAAADLYELAALAKDFSGLLPIKQFLLKDGEEKNSIEIDVVGAGRKLESTECAQEFLNSIINGYGYSVIRHEVNTGTIRIWAVRRGFS